jgi:hypothetical protein
MEPSDFRFQNSDLRFKSLEPHSKESMQPQSAIYNLKFEILNWSQSRQGVNS